MPEQRFSPPSPFRAYQSVRPTCALALACWLGLGCGGAGSGSGAGGSLGSGGATGSGGKSAPGGHIATGGSSSGVGGGVGSGGAIGSGGSSGTGGAAATAGRSGTGGSLAAGGASASGGTAGMSTLPGTGGGSATGGVTGRGGTLGAGGAPNGGTTGPSTGGAAGSSTARQDGGPGGVAGTDAAVDASGPGGADGGTDTGGGSLSAGCGKTMSRPDPKKQQTMTVGGATRYYLLDVPTSADNKTPLALVFGLHGYDMNNVAVVGLYNFTSRSGGKAITVYPQGEGPAPGDTSHWGDNVLKSTWNGNTANYDFIKALKEDLESRFCIDTKRELIAGFSMGGFFTNGLACAHSDWFRAYAPTSGGGPGSCPDANAKPAVIIHHGTADDIVDISSGEGTRDFWTKQNGCSQTTTSTLTGCKAYGDCAQPVLYCVGNWNHTISSTAAANIWSFFSSLP